MKLTLNVTEFSMVTFKKKGYFYPFFLSLAMFFYFATKIVKFSSTFRILLLSLASSTSSKRKGKGYFILSEWRNSVRIRLPFSLLRSDALSVDDGMGFVEPGLPCHQRFISTGVRHSRHSSRKNAKV